MVRFERQFETKGQIDGHRSVLGSVPHSSNEEVAYHSSS